MNVRWHEHTRPALADAIARDAIVILPVGSVEQHGLHIPLGCDTIIPERLAVRTAERLAGEPLVLVLPPLWYGYSPHHMRFAGTITLNAETLIEIVCQVCDSVLRHGIRRVVVLNGHGGNISAMDLAATRIGEQWSGRARIVSLTYWRLVAHRTEEFRESPSGGTGHAGEFETSLMLALNEPLVDMNAAVTNYPEMPSPAISSDLFESRTASVYHDFADLSETGTLGDPSFASSDKGVRILQLHEDELSAFLQDMSTWSVNANNR